jgi:regulator of replication initiation timing
MTKIEKIKARLAENYAETMKLREEEAQLNKLLSRALAKKSELPSEPGYYRGLDGIYELYEDGSWGDGWGSINDVSDVIAARPLIRLIEEEA